VRELDGDEFFNEISAYLSDRLVPARCLPGSNAWHAFFCHVEGFLWHDNRLWRTR
ncbi:hypothetical protein BKA93DRAFT_732836, partial [Sparassis latifolia]